MVVTKIENPKEKLDELIQRWGELKFERFANGDTVGVTGLVSEIMPVDFPGSTWTYEEIHDKYCYFYNDAIELSFIVEKTEVGEIKNIVEIAQRLRESKEPKDLVLAEVLFAAVQTYKDEKIMALYTVISNFGKE